MKGIDLSPVDSPHKAPVMWKTFSISWRHHVLPFLDPVGTLCMVAETRCPYPQCGWLTPVPDGVSVWQRSQNELCRCWLEGHGFQPLCTRQKINILEEFVRWIVYHMRYTAESNITRYWRQNSIENSKTLARLYIVTTITQYPPLQMSFVTLSWVPTCV